MCGNLDIVGLAIIPKDISGCMWNIAKEDVFSGVRDELSNPGSRRFHPGSTAKSSQVREVFGLTIWISKLDGRSVVASFWKCIGQPHGVVEGVGPELDSKVGASKEGSNGIREGSVSSLDRAILERGFSSSGSDFVSLGCEEISDSRIVIKLSALIKMDILVLTSVPGGVLRKEEPEPFNGGSFGGTSITIFHTREVISHKDPAGFTVESFIVPAAIICISRGLTGEGEVNG